MEDQNPWKTLNSELKYDNNWIRVTEHQVINPSGGSGIYGEVHFKNFAIGILPLDEEKNTWLVGQYRFPLKAYSWEIPEGSGPFHEDPLDSARRELLEETGLSAKNWKEIQRMHLSNSVSDEHAIIYLATDLIQGIAMPEETEQLIVKKVPFDTAYQMVLNGEITDSMSVAAILKAKLMLLNGELS
ncbi:8-oxo-dGTP pyrophosphatase MutT (NUDIX family) [Pedobacter psychrotolerans]|uniref:GDP-mannose pyrophosphatase n=1 Tax=Pedobacter psychrotolerans TaxID=1843235 RepID=A0A4R2H9S5_9SPHI|nr:NUDIX hydrolase [Pedobacter psychrotolerans]TCO23857.1 8-oxo-dGTP pyrophosphatase MutT (NUDIX family) [Pedobacter psychrotolerans]GGE63122.1 DNA mismatch repair protein MutT [Pedobacter psychrotolerans]